PQRPRPRRGGGHPAAPGRGAALERGRGGGGPADDPLRLQPAAGAGVRVNSVDLDRGLVPPMWTGFGAWYDGCGPDSGPGEAEVRRNPMSRKGVFGAPHPTTPHRGVGGGLTAPPHTPPCKPKTARVGGCPHT